VEISTLKKRCNTFPGYKDGDLVSRAGRTKEDFCEEVLYMRIKAFY
jgi:hypothetical protein